MTLHPYTEHDAREYSIRERTTGINAAGFQLDMLRSTFVKRGVVSHGLFGRLVQSIMKIGRHIPVSPEDGQAFERKMRDASVGDGTIHVDGNKVYIEGFFDLHELRKEMLW